MKYLTSFLALFLSLLFVASAQYRRNCATMQQFETLQRDDPDLLNRMRRIEEFTIYQSKSHLRMSKNLINIPVVVHVVYNTDAENISDEQVRSQIAVLNEDFGRYNADASETPEIFRKVAADTRIRFELASTDPDGKPSIGITRTYTDVEAFSSFDNEMKFDTQGGIDAWPTEYYLNIWVCNLSMGVLGYSQFPSGPAETDGVVIDYKFFGREGALNPPFNLGRTATHEVGHWLNLRHTWGDGPCGTDDFVADTPESEGPTHGCLRERETCGSQDMVSNFMDYTDDACMNLFTQGQAQRMRSLFNAGGARESMMYSRALEAEEPAIVEIPSPTLLKAQNITDRSARLSWEPIEEAQAYAVRIRVVGNERWAEREFSSTSLRMSDLNACSNYEFQVASMMADGTSSDFSPAAIFKTLGCTTDTPTDLVASAIYASAATVEWQPVWGVNRYKLQYRQAGTRKIISKEVEGNKYTIEGLVPGTWYQYRVRAIDPGNYPPYSKVASFYTYSPVSRMASAPDDEHLRVYPNGDFITVEFDHIDHSYVNLSILDLDGNVVYEILDFVMDSGVPYELNIEELTRGYYTLQIEDEDEFVHEKELRLR